MSITFDALMTENAAHELARLATFLINETDAGNVASETAVDSAIRLLRELPALHAVIAELAPEELAAVQRRLLRRAVLGRLGRPSRSPMTLRALWNVSLRYQFDAVADAAVGLLMRTALRGSRGRAAKEARGPNP
jgi:hypothetical protein